jgi:hypothetical protein
METKNKENKYKCEKCNFKCNRKARWETHILKQNYIKRDNEN